MVNSLYIKQGNKYKPVAPRDWVGFPTDGVWLVHHRQGCSSSECIMKIGEVPQIDLYKYVNDKVHLEQALNKAIGDKLYGMIKDFTEKGEITYTIADITKSVLLNLNLIKDEPNNGFYF